VTGAVAERADHRCWSLGGVVSVWNSVLCCVVLCAFE
jgi:hypothetical protein